MPHLCSLHPYSGFSERIHSYQIRRYLCSQHDADKPGYVANLEQQLSDRPNDIDNILEVAENYVKDATNVRKGIGSCGMDVIKGIAKELHCTLIYGDKVPRQNTEEAMAALTAFYARNGFFQKEGSPRISYDMRQYQCHDALHLDEAAEGGPLTGRTIPGSLSCWLTASSKSSQFSPDGIKRSFPEHAAPDRDGRYLQFQSKQIGAQHAGREPGFRAKNRVTLLHNGIRLGKIQIPELHDIIPGTFRKHKGIRVKFKKIGYESILIGGMAARITR